MNNYEEADEVTEELVRELLDTHPPECKNCGAQVWERDKKCAVCGGKL